VIRKVSHEAACRGGHNAKNRTPHHPGQHETRVNSTYWKNVTAITGVNLTPRTTPDWLSRSLERRSARLNHFKNALFGIIAL